MGSTETEATVAPETPIEKLPGTPSTNNKPDSASLTGHEKVYATPERRLTDDEDGPDDLEKQPEPGASSPPDDENIVFWDGDDDPKNPYNWPRWKKILNTVLVSSLSFLTPLGSAMFAPAVSQLTAEFHETSLPLSSFVVSVYILGFATGPMVFAPLSEMYGRLIIYHITNVGFLAFTIACAVSPSFDSLVAFRFMAGLFGSVPMTNAGGTIADMITQKHRGVAMSGFSVGPLLGPIVGPVAGGFLGEALGWRWVFWVLTILSGILTINFFVLARETYAPIILQKKTDRLRKETGNTLLRSKLDAGLSTVDFFKRSILRPCKMLVLSPICVLAALYVGIAFGYMYIVISSMSMVFISVYGFSIGKAGLCFLGLGVGNIAGVVLFSISSDRYMKKKSAEEKLAAEAAGREPAGMKPEYRLPPLIAGSLLLPIGLFIYGWTAQYRVHWMGPIVGTTVIGVAQFFIFMPLQTYLIDVFNIYAASALASNTIVRSILGAFLPMAVLPMYETLGYGWGNSLLAFIACTMIPATWVMIRYGEYLRTHFEIKNI